MTSTITTMIGAHIMTIIGVTFKYCCNARSRYSDICRNHFKYLVFALGAVKDGQIPSKAVQKPEMEENNDKEQKEER